MALDGKSILITGGLGGLGLGIARDLIARGARIFVSGRQAEAEGQHSTSEKLGSEARYIPLDVTVEADWERAVADIEDGLWGLVNNAGIVRMAPSFEETSLAEWRDHMAINLDGAFLGCRVALAAMAKTGGGTIVNISSAVANFAIPEAAAYCTAKAALLTLTRIAAKAGAKHQVRVNAILPGAIDTPMLWSHLKTGQDPQELLDLLVAGHPIGRIGAPADVAQATAFLLDPDSSFITGALLAVDGGQGLR